MRPRKLNFQKILMNNGGGQATSKPAALISRSGQLVLSKTAMQTYSFQAVDFLYDQQKRTLGWKKVTNIENSEGWTKTMKIVKTSPKGTGSCSIGRILTKLEIPKAPYSGLDIQVYEDNIFGKIYYVVLPKSPK